MQEGVLGSKSYLMVVEIHDAAVIWTLTNPVAAHQLAAGAFLGIQPPDFSKLNVAPGARHGQFNKRETATLDMENAHALMSFNQQFSPADVLSCR